MRKAGRLAGGRLALAAALVGITACTGGGGGRSPSGPAAERAQATTTVPAPAVAFIPTAGQVDVALDAPLAVSVTAGRLTSVSVAIGDNATEAAKVKVDDKANGTDKAKGAEKEKEKEKAPFPGQLDPAGTRWTSAPGTVLAPGATYEITANAVATDGAPTIVSSTFTTVSPANRLTARVSPLNGSTVGVGHPIGVYLSKAVADRAAVERRLTVTADPPVAGSWLWVSDTQLRWRPQQYWQPQTKVTLDASLAGVDFGGGVIGTESRRVAFTIGDSHISIIDAATYKMTVMTNGVLERTIPVSLGRPKYPTKSGIHVVMDKERTTIMDSASLGVPAGSPDSYRTKVDWAVRISNSGEFVHAAPWSVKDQGRRHVSHGCVNVSVANATWFFNYSRLGDVVEVNGTPDKITGTNGFGDWNVPYPAPV